MGKKHLVHRQWPVPLTALYRPDRDERIARAYELVLPLITRSTRQPQEEEPTNEAVPPHRHLRPRL
jgi:hypothetical protein